MIYLDYQATTPFAPEVREAMLPFLGEAFGNPHSPHRLGRIAKAAVEVAREQVEATLGLGGGRLIFTSGATEAVSWAIQSSLRSAAPRRRAVVTIATEHACVLETVTAMAGEGFEARILPVGADGIISLSDAAAMIDDNVALVVAMVVNNEIGVLQPIAELAALAHGAGAQFLCDAVQGFGRIDVPPTSDMVAISAHKVHGPKGIGALWVRDGLDLTPLIYGGGQQEGLRPGTMAPALCAGFGSAAQLLRGRRDEDAAHVTDLWVHALAAFGEEWVLNGSSHQRYLGNLNLRREGLDVARLMSEVRDVAFSAGSACTSGSGRPSHVLKAIGLSEAEARSSIRLGFGRYTTTSDIDEAAIAINAAATRQKA